MRLNGREDIQSVTLSNYKNKVKYIITVQRRIQNPVNLLRWSVLRKTVNGVIIFAKHSILDI